MSSSLMTADMLDHSKLHKCIRINIYAQIAKGIWFLCHETKNLTEYNLYDFSVPIYGSCIRTDPLKDLFIGTQPD